MGLKVGIGAATRAIEAAANTYDAAVTRGLVAWFFENDTIDKAKKNYAVAGDRAAVVGNPNVNSSWTSFKSLTNYLRSNISETAEMTFFVVVKSPDTMATSANDPMVFGNYTSLPSNGELVITFGVGLYFSSPTGTKFFAGRGNDVSDHTVSDVTITRTLAQQQAWALLFCRVSATKTELQDLTNGQTTGSTFATPRFTAVGKLNIGSGNLGFGGLNDIAIFAAHNVALTDPERDLQVARIRAYCAALPMPIIV